MTQEKPKEDKNNKSEKSKGEILKEKLFLKKESAWKGLNADEKKKVFEFCESYKKFMTSAKTEREAVKFIVAEAEKKGFVDISKKSELRTGDKIYSINKDKNIVLCVIGKNLEELRIVGSHVDSPRLDLKVHPLFEDTGLAFFKTNYYGGIKKYHWVNLPLAIHGVIYLKDGKKVELTMGEKEDDPIFIIPDLLPHLARELMKKEAAKVVEGEQLNVLIGSIAYDDDKVKESVKLKILELLNNEYGITEQDFVSAEIELVPAHKPRDTGLDKSMIAAYGHDDKSCSYVNMKAILDAGNTQSTSIAYFSDKEETGSDGATGAKSRFLRNFAKEVCMKAGCKEFEPVLTNAKAVSADVTAAVNPNYKEVHEMNNAAFIGMGVSLDKYGGGGGKYSTADASAEYMSYFRTLFDKNKIKWQTALLGKVDIGGGGTIAKFMAQALNCEIVDIGIPILGMHSPYEILSKIDLYETYRAYKMFFCD